MSITASQRRYSRLLKLLDDMGVSQTEASKVSVLCCDWLSRCLRKPNTLCNELDYLADVSGRLRPYRPHTYTHTHTRRQVAHTHTQRSLNCMSILWLKILISLTM
eukprot:COSAG05_NODE_2478_length_3011_cov_2.418613_5_plen_105_part_00